MKSTQKTAYFGAMLGLAIICGYVEMLIPFDFGVPGIKLGLANIVALVILYKNGFLPALAVNIARVLLVGILFGNAMGIAYALCGGILSLIVMCILKKAPVFSTVGVSVAGAAAHNIGQLSAALPIIGLKAVIFYLPFLLLAAVVTGFLVGLGAALIIKRVRLSKSR